MGILGDLYRKAKRALSRSGEKEVEQGERNSEGYPDQPAYSDRPEDKKVEVGYSHLKQPSYSGRAAETPITPQRQSDSTYGQLPGETARQEAERRSVEAAAKSYATQAPASKGIDIPQPGQYNALPVGAPATTNYAAMPTAKPVQQRAPAKSNVATSIDGGQQGHYQMPSPGGLADQLPSVPTKQYTQLPPEIGREGAPALPTTKAPKAPLPKGQHHGQLPSAPNKMPAGIIPKQTPAEIAQTGPVAGRGGNNEIK